MARAGSGLNLAACVVLPDGVRLLAPLVFGEAASIAPRDGAPDRIAAGRSVAGAPAVPHGVSLPPGEERGHGQRDGPRDGGTEISGAVATGSSRERLRWQGGRVLTQRGRFVRIVVTISTTKVESAVKSLRELGFSETEALVYAFLARSGPATGYRISHAVGKPTANTYKAVASLARQGAVEVDEGERNLVRAVPPDELLADLERRARKTREAARAALAGLGDDPEDERVYSLREGDQVLTRARALLARARVIVLCDLFPLPFDALAEDLVAAAARGVRVLVKVYERRDLPGVTEVLEPDARRALGEWPGQPLCLVSDAEEHLLALLGSSLDQVRQAVWSRSAFLSCVQHSHVAMELLHTAWRERGSQAASGALVGISLLSSRPPGLRRLRAQGGGPAAG